MSQAPRPCTVVSVTSPSNGPGPCHAPRSPGGTTSTCALSIKDGPPSRPLRRPTTPQASLRSTSTPGKSGSVRRSATGSCQVSTSRSCRVSREASRCWISISSSDPEIVGIRISEARSWTMSDAWSSRYPSTRSRHAYCCGVGGSLSTTVMGILSPAFGLLGWSRLWAQWRARTGVAAATRPNRSFGSSGCGDEVDVVRSRCRADGVAQVAQRREVLDREADRVEERDLLARSCGRAARRDAPATARSPAKSGGMLLDLALDAGLLGVLDEDVARARGSPGRARSCRGSRRRWR